MRCRSLAEAWSYLSDALAKHTGYVAEHPAFSHFLYFFSDCSSSSSVSVAFLLLWKKAAIEFTPRLVGNHIHSNSWFTILFTTVFTITVYYHDWPGGRRFTCPGGGLLLRFTRTLGCRPEERRAWPSPGDSPEFLLLAFRAAEVFPE